MAGRGACCQGPAAAEAQRPCRRVLLHHHRLPGQLRRLPRLPSTGRHERWRTHRACQGRHCCGLLLCGRAQEHPRRRGEGRLRRMLGYTLQGRGGPWALGRARPCLAPAPLRHGQAEPGRAEELAAALPAEPSCLEWHELRAVVLRQQQCCPQLHSLHLLWACTREKRGDGDGLAHVPMWTTDS